MRRIFALVLICLLTACAGPKYTLDDGRKVRVRVGIDKHEWDSQSGNNRSLIAASARD